MSAMISPSEVRTFDRLPPSSTDSEQCYLGSLMLVTEHADRDDLIEAVTREDFYLSDHQTIYDVLVDIRDAGKPTDPMVIREELIRRQLLDEIGGAVYLGQLVHSVPDWRNGAHYAEIVVEKSRLRRLIATGNEMVRRAHAPHGAEVSSEIVEHSQKTLADIVLGAGADHATTIVDIGNEVFPKLFAKKSLTTTGFGCLDARIGGIGAGEMVVIGARPSMGKSTLLRSMLLALSQQGIPAGLISLEESREKVYRNLLSAVSGIDNNKIRANNLSPEEWKAIDIARQLLNEAPIFVDDKARRPRDIRARCSTWARRHGVKVVLIDYLQRVQAEGKDRYEKATNASLSTSEMLKDLGLCGIVAVQLNRELRNREDKRPNMFDIRESGQIEQDADGILFLHREDYYHLDDGKYDPNQQAELIIAKWRDAARGGVVNLKSELRYQRFSEESPV